MTPPAEKVALKPCPFCGGEAEERKHSKRFDGDYVTSVGCCARVIDVGDNSRKIWNTRAGDAR